MTNPLLILDQSPFPQLDPNLVIGHIRWSKSLGLPEGDVIHAFQIQIVSYQIQTPGSPSDPRKWGPAGPHTVSAWFDDADDAHFFIGFMTTAWSTHYDPEQDAELYKYHYLDVTFREGAVWKTPGSVLRGYKTIQPSHMTFLDVGHPQILPDIWVNIVPPSLHLE